MGALDWIVAILVIVGALNWGLVGIGAGNVVGAVFGSIPALLQIVYVLVGLAGLWKLYKVLMG
ncbi:MAG: DUF378 domain-containing protein [Candidatus Aenigmarchaeota archaeon]|nr:DUF378 domain-containing protein [Candidatus Aenigmarchaeota archaeon]